MADSFSLQNVMDSFKSCLGDNKEIHMKHYIAGWKELVSFMNSLGNVFSFISRDAVSKTQIMERHLAGEHGAQYHTFHSMVTFELDSNLVDLVKREKYPESGCRTLLRLHRALQWLQLFLERLRTSSEDSKTSVLCSEAYNESLAQYHPWIIRKAAGMALCALPTRDTFFEVMNAGNQEQVIALLGEALPVIAEVHQVTEELYAKNNLLDLP